MRKLKNLAKSEYSWFLIILILGILLRLYRLESVPPGFTGDEAWLGLDGQEVAKKGWIGTYIPGHAWGYNALHAYIAGGLIRLLGPSIVAARLATALPGIFSLIFFYFLSRQFYSSKVSLLLLSLLSVSRWHIHFSRLAFPGFIYF
jgi:predicted membrane-bound mannosyltransferase